MKDYNSYLFVEVPEDAEDFKINIYGTMLLYKSDNHQAPFPAGTHLPKGQYTIIGLVKQLDWKDWVIIVDKENDGSGLNGWWYKYYGQDADIWTKNPTKSGLSLVKFLGMEDKNVLVLKKAA